MHNLHLKYIIFVKIQIKNAKKTTTMQKTV